MPELPKLPIKHLYSKYEPYLSPIAVMAGFIWDNLTLQRIDLLIENIVIIVYLSIALLSILFMNAYDAGWLRGRFFDKAVKGMPFLFQVVMGGLFSAFLIFYSRSATIAASWPFLLLLFGLLVGNEVFRKRYQRFVFHIAVFYIALFSYSVMVVPVVFSRIGAEMFVLSGIVGLVLIFLIILVINKIIPERVARSRNLLAITIGSIFIAFNLMYFLNLIPPIPLAMKESGIYHSVARTSEGYQAEYEPAPWYRFWAEWDDEFHWQPGQPVYSFSAVFAPTKIDVRISHRWSYYNEQKTEWETRDVLSYPMVGGRDGGYRGYSLKYGVEPGKWRVDIVTETGQILGRNKFEIIESDREADTKTGIK